jgi:1-acyl-sn-glycerol-3-phosphate acyltransferase
MMDVPLSCPYIPGPNKTIAKSSFAKIPLFGFFYMKGSVLVDRKSEASRRRSFEKMKEVLDEGMHMSVYPEGTRNRTSEPLKKFHDGAFKLATETGHDIIPAIMLNTKKVLPMGKTFYFWPQKLEIHFLPAVRANRGDSYSALKEKVFAIMKDYYVNHSN